MFGLLGYIGPETVMPIVSVLAAIGGALMLVGRSFLRAVTRSVCSILPGGGGRDTTTANDS